MTVSTTVVSKNVLSFHDLLLIACGHSKVVGIHGRSPLETRRYGGNRRRVSSDACEFERSINVPLSSHAAQQHGDLVQLLYDLATEAGANVSINTVVSSIQTGDGPQHSVILTNGEVINADVIIGADGCSSIVRPYVTGREESPKPAGLTVYTGAINIVDAHNDPELAPLLPMLFQDAVGTMLLQ